MSLVGNRVLVTGATGFIGSRVVEVLAGCSPSSIRTIVHRFMNAPRIARFPIEMIGGSLLDRDCVAAAMKDVDVVLHLAFGTSGSDEDRRRVTIEGTRVLCEEALREGVRRLVYTSTFSVYGQTLDDDLTETAPRRKSGDGYADSKLQAEALVLDFCRRSGLPAIVVQPTIAYGPYAFWSRWPLQQLAKGTFVLPEGGSGICNAVYVDDVVQALLLAACAKGLDGEVFLISGAETCTWADYFGRYAAMIPGSSLTFQPREMINKELKRQARDKTTIGRLLRSPRIGAEMEYRPIGAMLLRTARWALPPSQHTQQLADKGQDPKRYVYPLPSHVALFESQTRVRINKAVERLGYSPRTGLDDGFRKTEQWAKWFRLIS